MSDTQVQTIKPWYKHFWPWFMLMPLFVTVILSSFMLHRAFTKGDSVVSSQYYKNGLKINRLMDDLAAAKTLGVAASVRVDGERLLLQLISENPLKVEQLTLQFSHAFDSDFDLSLPLQAAGNNLFVAKKPNLASGKWYLDLIHQGESSWRIKRQFNAPVDSLDLAPIL